MRHFEKSHYHVITKQEWQEKDWICGNNKTEDPSLLRGSRMFTNKIRPGDFAVSRQSAWHLFPLALETGQSPGLAWNSYYITSRSIQNSNYIFILWQFHDFFCPWYAISTPALASICARVPCVPYNNLLCLMTNLLTYQAKTHFLLIFTWRIWRSKNWKI